jgi:ribosomal protein S18 acetylase RimI-like enzyme
MSLAVLPSHRHGGLGARLVEAFNQQSALRGATVVYLTTDAAGNDPVNHFYRRMGFNLVRTFETAEGRAMNEYERSLT